MLLMCYDLDDWQQVPTQILPPCSMPQTPDYVRFPDSCVAVQTGPARPMLEAAFGGGVKLTVQQLKDLCGELNLTPPSRGSGKNGAVKKIDIAEVLLRSVFPDITPEQLERRLQLLGASVNPDALPEVMPEDTSELTLKLLAMLDPAEKESFRPIIKEALDRIEAMDSKSKRERKLREKLGAERIEPNPLKGGAGRTIWFGNSYIENEDEGSC